MLFFKYQKPATLEFTMLRRGEIYFASPSELNDANECRPQIVLNGSVELWQRFAGFVLQEVAFRFGYDRQISPDQLRDLLQLSGPVGQALKKRVQNRDLKIGELSALFLEVVTPLLHPLLPGRSREILQRIREYIGIGLTRELQEDRYIASFSLAATNPTMWAHYGGVEKGFAIVFASDDGCIHVRSPLTILWGSRERESGIGEIGIYNDERLELQNVRYCPKIPKINAFHRLIPKFMYTEEEHHYDVPDIIAGDAAGKQENRMGLVKYSDWRYEKEVRAFFPTYGRLHPDVRALRVDIKNFAGLIFGPKMSLLDKERAIICCYLMRKSQGEEHDKDFIFFQAEQHAEAFPFKIRPVGILDRLYYGDAMPFKPIGKLPDGKAQELTAFSKTIQR